MNLKNSKDESSSCRCQMKSSGDENDAKCIPNSVKFARYAHRFPRGHWSLLGPGLEKTWHRICTEKPNGEWDGTEASMILELVTESRHSVFRASSAFERGELDIREYGEKSTRLSDNDRNVELLLRTIKSVNPLSICLFIADWSQNLDDENSSGAPSSDDSDSSGTLCAIQILETRRLQKEDYNVSRKCQRLQDKHVAETKQLFSPIHPSKQRRQNPNQQFQGSQEYDYVVDRKTGWRWFQERQ